MASGDYCGLTCGEYLKPSGDAQALCYQTQWTETETCVNAEIELRGNGNLIGNYNPYPDPANHTDFGNVMVADTRWCTTAAGSQSTS